MRPTDGSPDSPSATAPAATAERRPWPETLRALREARGATQEGWAARLGVNRKTVQRWESGERAPDHGAEAAVLSYCREAGLFRSFTRGPLAGLTLTEAGLQDLFAEARWRGPEHVAPPLPAADGARQPALEPAPVLSSEPSPEPVPAQRDTPEPALETEAPPPPPPPAPPTNLPASLTSFVGREQELAAVRRVQAGTRLLTLTGPGGGGKTRLSLALAGELLWAYPHGVWFVDLAPLAEPALLPEVVAAALAVRPAGQQHPTVALLEALQMRRLLLLLDNCEHLLPVCAELVETLLRACPHLEVLATSRQPLGIEGEAVWRVPPLTVPDFGLPIARFGGPPDFGLGEQLDKETASPSPPSQSKIQNPKSKMEVLGATDAERLFVERVRLRRPEFAPTPDDIANIAEICRRLDGMPLAIELAAARTTVLSVGQIAARLDDRFQLLTGGTRAALPRRQTLRAAMDWSYDLLTAEEQAVLRALSVFAGSFTLEAAEAVCDFGLGGPRPMGELVPHRAPSQSRIENPKSKMDVLDLLAHLVDKSLVLAEEQGRVVRYRLLETVRQYAAQKLDVAGDALAMRRRHAAWCLTLAEQAAAAMDGPQTSGWLARLAQEHDNLRAALSWSLEQGRRLGESEEPAATTAVRLAGALSRFWELRGYLGEGRRWLSRALTLGSEAPAAERARALHGAGSIGFIQGDFAAARALFAQSLALYGELADEHGVAEAQWDLGRTASRQGDYAAARGLLEASLARYEHLGHQPGIATLRYALGVLLFRQGNYAAAVAQQEASLALQRRLGNKHGIANSQAERAAALWEQDQDGAHPAQFEALLAESVALYRDLGEKSGVAAVLGHRGMRAWAREQYEQAQALLSESLALCREVENRRGIARVLGQQGLVAYSRRDYAPAAALCRESVALHYAVGETWEIGRYLWVWGAAAFEQGQPERAARLFGAAVMVRERLGAPLPPVFRPAHDSTVAALRESLGEPAFAAAWAAGQALSIDEAIDH